MLCRSVLAAVVIAFALMTGSSVQAAGRPTAAAAHHPAASTSTHLKHHIAKSKAKNGHHVKRLQHGKQAAQHKQAMAKSRPHHRRRIHKRIDPTPR
ncbi:hypothetical protein [Telmatospirillum sp.]|uniref:hypothetical protein n=1 Tax=Telmatospirillum sp. TaxID=2079197 RepID=UPI00284AD227|nr:hypothetical protein [Telmatospirillum sp.]MDR3440300.1 hypothetical protein [Telmatospirillum sp.]